jgi:hypothetical protein
MSSKTELRAVIITAIAFAGCTGPSARQYDKLCKIYDDVAAQPSSPELFVSIGARVEEELPGILQNYTAVMMSQPADRYDMLRQLARVTSHQDDWQCAAIRARFPPATETE